MNQYPYPYVLDPANYPWATELQQHWKTIKAEYDNFCNYIKDNSGGTKIVKIIKLDSQGNYTFPGEILPDSLTVTTLSKSAVDYKLTETVVKEEVDTRTDLKLLIEKKHHIISVPSRPNTDLLIRFTYNPLINFVEKIYDGTWIPFSIYRFGMPNPEVEQHFPETLRLLGSIPGLETAMYSLIEPGTHIKPHKGYSKNVLRCHIGLTPKQDAYLRVGEVKLTWDEGSVFVFDDTEEHEVLHSGNATRVSFIIDFKRDATADSNYPEFLKKRIEEIKTNTSSYKR
jgi:ornithine lipid ester-linked acyl 2-hydroxylase